MRAHLSCACRNLRQTPRISRWQFLRAAVTGGIIRLAAVRACYATNPALMGGIQ